MGTRQKFRKWIEKRKILRIIYGGKIYMKVGKEGQRRDNRSISRSDCNWSKINTKNALVQLLNEITI